MIISKKKINNKLKELLEKNDDLLMYGITDHDEEVSRAIKTRCDGYERAIDDVMEIFKIK